MNGTRIDLIVDPQIDFCEGGALPVDGGNAAMEALAEYLRRDDTAAHATATIVSQDWHRPDHLNGGHFPPPGETPNYNTTWPPHCVQNTRGAELHPAVAQALPPDAWRVIKGMGKPAYSLFEGETLHFNNRPPSELITKLATWHGQPLTINVYGLATDHCVYSTATGAKTHFPHATVTVFTPFCAGVNPETTLAAIADMRNKNIVIV